VGSAKTTEDRTSQVESSTKIKLWDKNIKLYAALIVKCAGK